MASRLLQTLLRTTACAFALTAMGLAPALAADPYPTKQIRLVVPTVAGGLADIYGRLMAKKMSEKLGQQVIVDNKPGADTLIGTRFVREAPADGYTILLQAGGISVFPHIKLDPGYELKDFTAIGPFARHPFVMMVGADQPDKSLADFIQRAKANPGKMSYAHGGLGTPPHIAAAMFLKTAGVNILPIAYKGNAAAFPDVVSGRADMIFDSLGSAAGLIKSGKVKGLGISTPSRMPTAPELPTLAEQGYPGFSFYGWLGLLAPAGTPKEVVDKLAEAVTYAITSQEVLERFRGDGNEAYGMAPAAFNEYLKTEAGDMGRLVQELKLPKQ